MPTHLPLPRLLLVLILTLLAAVGVACSAPTQATTRSSPAATAAPVSAGAPTPRATERPLAAAPTALPTAKGPKPPPGMRTIQASQLPPEARQTLALVYKGGPFPYRQDGQTFQNRERLLTPQPDGYYREYTVETPGSNDRGARRLVVGREGEVYYTDDHYASFKWVIR